MGCLLVHGFVSAPQEMKWLGQQLNESGFSVLGVRLFGHATRPSDLHRVRWQDWAASIEDGYHLLKDQCSQIALIGMSLGGALAAVVSTYLPFGCLITISTPFQTIPYPSLSFLRWAVPALGLVGSLVRSLPKPPPLDFVDRDAARDHLTYSVFPSRGILECDQLIKEMHKCLPKISIPVLVIHSKTDRGVPLENADRIIHEIGSESVRALILDGGGHVVLLEPERERAAAGIIEFIIDNLNGTGRTRRKVSQ